MNGIYAGIIKDGANFSPISINSNTGAVIAELDTGAVQATGLYIDTPLATAPSPQALTEKFEEDMQNAETIGLVFMQTGYIELTDDTAYIYDWAGNLQREQACSFDLDPDEDEDEDWEDLDA